MLLQKAVAKHQEAAEEYRAASEAVAAWGREISELGNWDRITRATWIADSAHRLDKEARELSDRLNR